MNTTATLLPPQGEPIIRVRGVENSTDSFPTSRWERLKTKLHSVWHTSQVSLADFFSASRARLVRFFDRHPRLSLVLSESVLFTAYFITTFLLVFTFMFVFLMTMSWVDILLGG